MLLIHTNAYEWFLSDLDLFSVLITHRAEDEGQFAEIHPLAALVHITPREFVINEISKQYLDRVNTFIDVRAKSFCPAESFYHTKTDLASVNYYLKSNF